ncbi:MAG: hypothetical protein AB8B97_10405 [Granulosicoccus sp.]
MQGCATGNSLCCKHYRCR